VSRDKGRKLTKLDVCRIKQRLEVGQRAKEQATHLNDAALAAKFDAPQHVIRALCSGRKCRSLSDEDKRLLGLCFDERTKLLAEAQKHSQVAVARDYGVSVSLISHIALGNMWREVCCE